VKHQVLILDDEPEVRRVVRQQLSGTRFDVLEAETAEQAMDLLRDYAMSVDVVICDVRMPGISGVEAVSYIREAHPTKPIIVLTGHPDLDLAVDFMKSGVVDYIVKPVEKDKLVAAVEKAAEKH
jgi:DNA-binding NtrC family response regulator